MPIRAAVLTLEQMQEYTRTGEIPKGARYEAYDDRGLPLESTSPPSLPIKRLLEIAAAASKLGSQHALTDVECAMIDGTVHVIADRLRADPALKASDLMQQALTELYHQGYVNALADVMAGKAVIS